MSYIEILTISALILGPILAVQVEKFLSKVRQNREQKLSIFKTLMSTRGSVLSVSHVEALNRIDIEFYGDNKYQKVIEAWKEYLDNLNQKFDDKNIAVWSQNNEALLTSLLYEMGISLGYKFDKVQIKRNAYSPVGHANIELEQEAIRKGFIDLLDNKTAIPVTFIQDEKQLTKQSKLADLMISYYEKELKNP